MTTATDQQVQNYVDQNVRPRSEQIYALYLACKSDKALIDDVYAALTQQKPTWADSRTDSPPHLLTPNDVLAWNGFISAFISLVEGSEAGDYTIVQKARVRSVA